MPAPKRATKSTAAAASKAPTAATRGATKAASTKKPSAPAGKAAASAQKAAAPKPVAAAKKTPAATKSAPVAPAKGKATPAKPAKAAPAKPAKAAPAKATAAPAAAKSSSPKKTATKAAAPKTTPDKTSDNTSVTKNTKTNATATKKPAFDKKFLDEQRALLLEERAKYLRSSQLLKAEADALVLEREPGDVQFDEESGEGDTLAVERDFDLALSAQARQQVDEIDAALQRLDAGTYGLCRVSGEPIPRERLQAIPWATEKVEYKVGGLGRR
jgi:RNA polymerase-binding transcription factor DksA